MDFYWVIPKPIRHLISGSQHNGHPPPLSRPLNTQLSARFSAEDPPWTIASDCLASFLRRVQLSKISFCRNHRCQTSLTYKTRNRTSSIMSVFTVGDKIVSCDSLYVQGKTQHENRSTVVKSCSFEPGLSPSIYVPCRAGSCAFCTRGSGRC